MVGAGHTAPSPPRHPATTVANAKAVHRHQPVTAPRIGRYLTRFTLKRMGENKKTQPCNESHKITSFATHRPRLRAPRSRWSPCPTVTPSGDCKRNDAELAHSGIDQHGGGLFLRVAQAGSVALHRERPKDTLRVAHHPQLAWLRISGSKACDDRFQRSGGSIRTVGLCRTVCEPAHRRRTNRTRATKDRRD